MAQNPDWPPARTLLAADCQHAFVPAHNDAGYLPSRVEIGLGLQCMHVICRKSRHAWFYSALARCTFSLIPDIPVAFCDHLVRLSALATHCYTSPQLLHVYCREFDLT